MRIAAAKKLHLVQLAVYSAGETITPAQALAFIASLFDGDPGTRLSQEMLTELLNIVTPPKRVKKRSQRGG